MKYYPLYRFNDWKVSDDWENVGIVYFESNGGPIFGIVPLPEKLTLKISRAYIRGFKEQFAEDVRVKIVGCL